MRMFKGWSQEEMAENWEWLSMVMPKLNAAKQMLIFLALRK